MKSSGSTELPSRLHEAQSSSARLPRETDFPLERRFEGWSISLLTVPAGTRHYENLDHHTVGVHVGRPVFADCACGALRRRGLQLHGDTDVVPAGFPARWSDASDCTILRISIRDDHLRRTLAPLARRPSQAELPPRMGLRDSRLAHIASALALDLQAEDPPDSLYLQSLCTALVLRLSHVSPSLPSRRPTFSPKAAARLAEYIDTHLGGRLGLPDLARFAGVSVPHFSVLFRETFGLSAHQYVVRQRVEHARDLLLLGGKSITQIALETGFAHGSHLAKWMNRILGQGPSSLAAPPTATRTRLRDGPDEAARS